MTAPLLETRKTDPVVTASATVPNPAPVGSAQSKLVYRVKIAVDNRQGVLKQGMPVEAEIPLQ